MRDWEAAADPARAGRHPGRLRLRSGIVLSRRAGCWPGRCRRSGSGLGARLGPGTQFISWVTLTDWIRAAQLLIGQPGLSGPVNLTTPNPVTNAAFTAALAAVLHRPARLAIPSPVLSAALGGVTSDLLSSARVRPTRLLDAGFTFSYPDMAGALTAELHAAGSAA